MFQFLVNVDHVVLLVAQPGGEGAAKTTARHRHALPQHHSAAIAPRV